METFGNACLAQWACLWMLPKCLLSRCHFLYQNSPSDFVLLCQPYPAVCSYRLVITLEFNDKLWGQFTNAVWDGKTNFRKFSAKIMILNTKTEGKCTCCKFGSFSTRPKWSHLLNYKLVFILWKKHGHGGQGLEIEIKPKDQKEPDIFIEYESCLGLIGFQLMVAINKGWIFPEEFLWNWA